MTNKIFQDFVLQLNQQARELGYSDGFCAYLEKSGKSLESYLQIKQRFDEELKTKKASDYPDKRKRFFCYQKDYQTLLARCGIDVEGQNIQFVEGLQNSYTDVDNLKIVCGINEGKVDLKAVAHEMGHLTQLKQSGRNILAIDSEIESIKYEFQFLNQFCLNQKEVENIRFERIYKNLYRSEAKRYIFETEDFEGAQKKLFEIRNHYDICLRWGYTLDILSADFSELNYLFGIAALR